MTRTGVGAGLLATLFVAALALSCTDSRPMPEDLRVSYILSPATPSPDEGWVQVIALIGPPDSAPDGEDITITANGDALALDTLRDDDADRRLVGATAKLADEQAYEVTLTLPGSEPLVTSIAPLGPAELVTPLPGAEISASATTEVTWSQPWPRDTSIGLVTSPEGGAEVIQCYVGFAEPGVPTGFITTPRLASCLETLAGAGISVPFEAEIVLVRSHSRPTSPPFGAGSMFLEQFVTRVPIRVVP